MSAEQFSRHTIAEPWIAAVSPSAGLELDAPMGRLVFGLLSGIYALHLVNLGLLLALAVRLGIGTLVASLALGVFGLHAGVAEVFWSPGHVSEVLCGSFALLSLWFWLRQAPLSSALTERRSRQGHWKTRI